MLFGLFNSNPLKDKVKKIKKRIKDLAASHSKETVWINQIGAYDIDPKHLFFCVCVKTDKEKQRLESDHDLKEKFRQTLIEFGYPTDAINKVEFGFESQQTVDRVSNGNWFSHFK